MFVPVAPSLFVSAVCLFFFGGFVLVIIKNPLGKYFTPTLIVFITDLHLLQTPSALLLVLLITATRLLLFPRQIHMTSSTLSFISHL